MEFANDTEVINYVKLNQKPQKHIQTAREETKRLKALVTGKDFKEELINKIEKIESKEKAEAREKYSRSIKDMFERLLRPLDNVYHSTGGSKHYHVTSETNKKKLLTKLANIRGGKSLEAWLECFWMPQYHSDPSGVIFMEYTTTDGVVDPYPTYKSINNIRNYTANGQNLEVIIFEPKKVKIGETIFDVFRVVDDKKDYQVLRKGEDFEVVNEKGILPDDKKTFEHPFGKVPGLVNSDLVDIDVVPHQRLSPIHSIDELTEEIARDQSIKTIYKFQNGFPIHWRYVQTCYSCKGNKRDGDKACPDCNGHGFYKSADVTDMVTLPLPKEGEQKIAPEIAGHISPALETWTKYDEENNVNEDLATKTHWGAVVQNEKKATATEIINDVQPIMNRLDKYSDVAESMEQKLTEWVANAILTSKPKDEKISSINYGRRYIIEPPDVIIEKYNTAKKNGDNNTILDRLYNEYLTSKYKTDPLHLRVMLLKSDVEPYLHSTIEQIVLVFGNVEAQRKILFQEWWETLSRDEILDKNAETLRTEFNTWFDTMKEKFKVVTKEEQ